MGKITDYKNKTLSQLKATAVRHFHKYIRLRDKDKPCISCGKHLELQAGHFFSAGHYPELKFNEENVNGQCKKCNYFLHGDLINYANNLRDKIGQQAFEKLHEIVQYSRRNSFKWNRFFLIETIEKYKHLNKEL